MLSFIGILLGLALFVITAFRGVNLILSAIASACIMFVFSGVNPMTGLVTGFLPGLASFVQGYFLLFLFSALMGRLMSDGGVAKRIALSLANLTKKCKNKKEQRFFCMLLVPALYFILTYVGISGFVVVFTVMPIAKDLYSRTDTPWRLYCSAGAQSIGEGMLVGSLTAANIYAADVCGTTTMAGLKLSIVMVATYLSVSVLLMRLMLNHIERTGEGFLPSGAGIRQASLDEGVPEDQLPGLIPSLLPMAAVLVLSAGFGMNVVLVLCIGCALNIAVGWKNLGPRLKESVAAGVTSSYSPILSVAATYAIGVILKNLEGFALIENSLARLPGLMEGAGFGMLTAFIMASAAAPTASFGQQMLDKYLAAGLSAENAHRMMTLTTFASIAPHNAGIINAAQVLRLPYADCIRVYMLFTYVPGIATLAVSLLCLWLGIV